MGKLLSAGDILSAQDERTDRVSVPEWGGDVIVRGLTGNERDSYEESIIDQRGKNAKVLLKGARAKLIALTCVDEQGNRVFSDDQVKALGRKSALAMNRVFKRAQELSGITDEDLEEMTEAFADAQGEDGSGSPTG